MSYADDKPLRDALRKAFAEGQIGQLPRVTCKDCSNKRCSAHKYTKCKDCGAYTSPQHIHLPFVAHAIVTDRLNHDAPGWYFTIDTVKDSNDGEHVLAVVGTMHIGDKAIPEIGEPNVKSFYGTELQSAIGNFIRRAAMRFGVAIDLWMKEEAVHVETSGEGAPPSERRPTRATGAKPPSPDALVAKGGPYSGLTPEEIVKTPPGREWLERAKDNEVAPLEFRVEAARVLALAPAQDEETGAVAGGAEGEDVTTGAALVSSEGS